MKRITAFLIFIILVFPLISYAQPSIHFVSRLCEKYENDNYSGKTYKFITVTKMYIDSSLCNQDTISVKSGQFKGCGETCNSGTEVIKQMFNRQPIPDFPYIYFKSHDGYENIVLLLDFSIMPASLLEQTIKGLKEGGAADISVIYPKGK